MKKDDNKNSSGLRRKAEKRLKAETIDIEKLSEEDVRKLAHELQVYQVELEMQNEELRTAQVLIEESQQKYLRLYDFAPIGYFNVSGKGIILKANLTGASMLGIERSLLIKQPLSKFMSKEDANKYYLHHRTVHAEKVYRASEVKMVRKDGTEFYAQLACTAIQNEDESSKQCLTVITDITEFKRIEDELRKSEEIRNRIIESSVDCIKILDVKGNLLFMSKGGQNAFEIEDIGPLLNQSWLDYWKGSDHKAAIAAVSKAKKGEIGTFHGDCPTLKDTPKWWDVIVSPIIGNNGKVEQLLSVSRDITERKNAELALKESEKRYAIISRMTSDYVYHISSDPDKNMTVDWITDGFSKLTGYSLDDVSTPDKWMKIIHPDDFTKNNSKFESMLSGNTEKYECRVITKKDEILWLHINGGPEWDEKRQNIIGIIGAVSNITERKETDEKIIRLAKFPNENPNPVLRVFNDRIIYNNRASIVLLDSWGCQTTKMLPDNYVKIVSNTLHSNLNEMIEVECNNNVYSLTFAPVIEDGYVNIYGLDITKRKKAEQDVDALNESLERRVTERTKELIKATKKLEDRDERLQAIMDNTTAVIYLKDTQGRYLLINLQFESLFHISSEEVIGKTDYEIFPEAIADSFVTNDKKVIETLNPLEIEEIAPHDDGLHTYFSIKIPLFDSKGVLYGVCGISTDITEHKRVNEALQKSESRLSEAQRIAHLGNWDWDIVNNKLLWSDEVYRIFGFKPHEFTVTYELFLNTVHPDDRELIKRVVDESLYKGKAYNIEHRVVLPNGTERIVYQRAEVTLNNEGKPVRMIGTVQDITEARKAEEELLKMQKLESVGVLAGGIAHDFNNYLQGIMGVITLADAYASPDNEIHTKLEEAKQIIRQSKHLTQQLLTFSEGGEPVKSTIHINQFLKDIASVSLSGSNIRCKFSMPDSLWPVDADKGQLNQIFNNLIINASQSMPEGGSIKILAENFPVIKKDSLQIEEGMYVKITVEDHGTGISKENMTKIFDPYFTTRKEGSGLGLATVYSITRKHNGTIKVESEMGVGTTFHIYLPASEKEILKEPVLSKEEPESTEKGPVTRKRKVLLMDDETSIRLSATENLRDLKYEVEAAREGEEAIMLYKDAMESNEPFDAVILDLTIIDGMGGEKTMEKLLEIDPDVKAIVVSGYVKNRIMANFKKYGFSDILAKPYETEELDEILQNVIKSH